MLEKLVESFDPRLPRIDHLVTVATPNTGAPLARAGRGLDERTWSGRFVTGALSSWARRRGPVPDPSSVAVRQIAPGSALMDSIAAEDVTYGTQVLALAAPSDIIVPADRALYPGKRSRMVVPPGLCTGTGRS
jgi:hypothetical protein